MDMKLDSTSVSYFHQIKGGDQHKGPASKDHDGKYYWRSNCKKKGKIVGSLWSISVCREVLIGFLSARAVSTSMNLILSTSGIGKSDKNFFGKGVLLTLWAASSVSCNFLSPSGPYFALVACNRALVSADSFSASFAEGLPMTATLGLSTNHLQWGRECKKNN